jgi:hypothetical protein
MKTRGSKIGDGSGAAVADASRAGGLLEASKKQQTRPRASLPRNLSDIVSMRNWVKQKLHGQDITANVSLRVLRGALKMQEDYLLKLQKKGGNNANTAVSAPSIRQTICSLFAISEHNYSAILGNYLHNKTIYSSGETGEGRSGNRCAKESRIPQTKAMTISIMEFVRERRTKRERTTAKQVMEYLVAQEVLHIPKDSDGLYSKKEYNSTYRNVRRFMAKLGYTQGRHTGNIVPTTAVLLERIQYLKAFHDNRIKPQEERLREVYVDESSYYGMFDSYEGNEDESPEDDQEDAKLKMAPVIAAAIQGPSTKGNGRGGFVPGSLCTFSPQKQGHIRSKQVIDFTNLFIKWWTDQLLPNLNEPSLIILDNASYHCCKHPDTPNPARMKKQECVGFLAARAPAVVTAGMTMIELQEEVKKYIEACIPMEIVRLAGEKGHKVLFTPQYHSYLQPMELVWALLVKDNVGLQDGAETKLQIINQRCLDQEFEKLQASGQGDIERMIEQCADIASKMYDEAMEADGTSSSEEEEEDHGDAFLEEGEEHGDHEEKNSSINPCNDDDEDSCYTNEIVHQS